MFELFITSLKVLVLGLGIAFAGLSLLIVFVNLMKKVINDNNKKKENKSSSSVNADVSQEQGNSEQYNNTGIEEDDELIAVIAAAVAAALNKSTHDIIVKSVRRIASHSPVWNRTGRQEQIRTRL